MMDDADVPAGVEGRDTRPPSVRRRAFVGSTWVFVGKATSTLVAFATGALLARLLTPDEFGGYFLATSLVTVGATVAELGLRQTAVRLIAESMATGRPDEARAAIRVILRLTILGAIIVTGVLALGLGRLIADDLVGSTVLADAALLAAAWVAMLAVQQVLAEIFRGLLDLRFATILEGLLSGALSAAVFAALWVLNRDVGLSAVLGVSAAASAITVIVAAVLLRRRVGTMQTRAHLPPGPILNMAWPFLVTGIVLFAVNAGTDVWIIGAALGAGDVALYGAASRLIGLLVSPMLILLSVAPPFIAALNAQGKRDRLERAIRGATALVSLPSLLGFLVVVFVGEQILGAVYGSFYRQADGVALVLAVGYLANVLAGPCGLTLMMTGHQRSMMRVTIVAGALSVAGALALVHPFGITGVAWATSAGLVVQNCLLLWSVHRRLGIWTLADFSPGAIAFVLGLDRSRPDPRSLRDPD